MAKKSFESAVADFTQSMGTLVRHVRAAASSQELSLTEASVLARAARDGPATIADLARAEGVKPQSMGTVIAGLEERGLIERKPHPVDGRQMHIELTAKGVAMRNSVRDAKRTWLAQAIARLEEADRETLFKAGEIMNRLVEKR